jgi:hypothetical protein
MNTSKTISTIIGVILMILFLVPSTAIAKKPAKTNVRAQFIDFENMIIDGQIKKPRALYTSVRQRVNFKRLLRLKKDFTKSNLFDTAKSPVFK